MNAMEKMETVAKTFSALLLAKLGRETMLDIVARNRSQRDQHICHTHDFCDANMVMAEAFERHGVDTDSISAWNMAWGWAKRHEFWVK
jgi:hypothetical protein